MNTKTLKTLEYDKVINILSGYADSEPGKELCKNLLPSIDMKEIQESQINTSDALARIFRDGSTSFGSNRNFSYALSSLSVGSSLSVIELLHFASFLDNVARVISYGLSNDSEEERSDSLTEYFKALSPLTHIANEINHCIISEDEIADDASPTLKNIRRQINITGEKIRSQLNSMLNGSMRTYLQDAVITMRNNRYCLPVKAEYKSHVNGMVHDQSSSGSTFFIEPAAIVSLNNNLKELAIQEQKEIEVILATLSASLAEHIPELKYNCQYMTLLDFIFAKGRLALEQRATMPQFNRKHYLNLKKARHPLLNKDKVVPIDVYLGRDFDLLIITGPNTGGKTVSMKTVGLLSLMGQAGLHIPTNDRSELCIFNDIFADIGDEQSIEQSLSTFSSHMVRIVDILKSADRHSLCLFDELAAGTDPTEGAALATAILTNLHEKGIRTIATTHYSELKIFALTTEGVTNACCEFNVESLRPTYKLLIGIPGKSNAFAISSKLGLSDEIINSAKNLLSSETETFEDVIANLENTRIAIDKDKKEIAEYKEKIRTLQEQLHNKNEKIDNAKDKILREANEEARAILQEAKEIADETIRDMHKASVNTDMNKLEKSRQKVNDKIKDKNSKLSVAAVKKAPSKTLDPSSLRKGDSVKIISMGLKGTVNTLPDAKGNLFVMCGIMRTQANIKDLVRVQEEEIITPGLKVTRSATGEIKMNKSMSVSTEINLLGCTVDEALSKLEKYLDDAYIAHMSQVRVVHGKGTGALRTAVHNYLRRQKTIAEYRLGEFGEGDAGVTIVTFK